MAVSFLLDHIVIRVDDLSAAMAAYTALGFTVLPGGEHPGLGSHNALICFADGCYLELIAFRGAGADRRIVPKPVRAAELADAPPMERHVRPWETAASGLIDFALLPSSAEAAVTEARARGLSMHGPLPGGRRRPDGQLVSWQLAFADGFDLPFLCADVTPRALRVPEGAAREHRNGTTGIAAIVIAVADLNASMARYRALLGDEPRVSLPSVYEARTAGYVLGSSFVTLAEPTADGPLRDYLAERGEGPFELTLTTRNAATAGPHDPPRTQGIRLNWALVDPPQS